MTRASRARGFGLRTFLVTTAMVLSGLHIPIATAAPDCVDVQQTPQAASDMAKRCDLRVEIYSHRSETSQTFANPKGGYTTEESVEPRFARQADGSWSRVDTTLRANGKTVKPAAAVLPIEFSAGGDGPAAKLRDGDREVSITWPYGALPKPVLSGAEATYPEVLPGVDLKLTASSQGFSQFLVVKNREAAKNPKLAKVKFAFGTKGVTAHAKGGGLEAKDSAGKVVFNSPTPLMWDSGQDAVAHVGVLSKSAVESKKKRTATMPVSVQNGELTVTPDTKLLDEAQYPVTIDPSWTGRVQDNAWTLVSSKSGHEGSAFWQGRNNQGQDYLSDTGTYGAAGTGRICDSVSSSGACLSAQYHVRSYFRMDTSAVKGKQVTGASFRIEQKWAFTCNNGGSNATVRTVGGFDGGTTWNSQPAWFDDNWRWSSPANRKVGAVHGCAGPGDVEFNFTGVVQHAANNNWHNVSVVLHVDESHVNYWKRFNAGSAVLAIDYNSIPNQPDQTTVDGKGCATGDARPVVPTATPTIRGRVSDPDGADTMTARFEWRRIRPNGSRATVAHIDNSPWGNGTTAEYTVLKPDTLPNGVVEWSDNLVGTGDWNNDGKTDLLIRDLDGYLYVLPTVDTPEGRRSGDRVEIGWGWNGFTIAGVADWDNDGNLDIIARWDDTGDLYLYPGDGKLGHSELGRVLIGWGWRGFTYAGVADYDRDGNEDTIARDPDGVLWMYPGDGRRQPPQTERMSLGWGWNGFTYAGVADRTGDGAPDIFAYWEADGTMFLYPGSGTRAPYTGDPGRYVIGWGWQGSTPRTIKDLDSDDGSTDIVAQVPFSSDWFFYPGRVGTEPGPDRRTMAGRGMTTGNYEYRMTASDGRAWGPASGWCEFAVDRVAPDAPTFSSSVYKDKSAGCPAEGCGSLGIADTFTFASTSTDVVKYKWGFTDSPSMVTPAGTPVRWTPPSHGSKTLFVDAIDKGGLATRSTFQFTVAGAKPNEASWFNGDDPAFDGTGNGHDLTLTGVDPAAAGRTVGGQTSVGFNGSNTATTAKVLDTSKGFSVSAWVRLTNDTANRTVVSQQGSATSAFKLGYDSASRKWNFSLAESDAANAALKTAVSDVAAAKGVWTHLTGTYDSRHKEVRLYVDGALQRTIAVVDNGFDAGGQLRIGQGWQGELAEVRAWNRTITQPESVSMADASVVSGVGEWKFNEGSGSIARDSSPYGRDVTLNLAGGASWGQGVQGGGGLALNGTNSSASTSEAVLNTDQSFSVDVWAKLNDTGAPRTVVVQRGPSGVDPFTLKYDGTQWSAEMPNASTNPTTTWRAKAEAVVNKWTHLVATYDASARTLKLTVGYKTKEDSPEPPDALKSTVTGVVGWNSTGVLSVGRSSAGEFFNGNVDELKTWQGVLAPTPLDDTQRNGASVSGDNLDEFIRVEANGDVQAFLNQNGIYPGAPQHIGSGWTPERTFFADIDGDGKSEIVAVDADGTIRAFKNVNGMNGFPFAGPTTIGTATSGEAIRTKFADVDGDGRADRISVDADGRVRAYRNLFGMNERGQSTAFSTTPVILTVTAHTPDRVLFADVDGDRKAEFITVNQDQTVSGYLNLSGLGYGSYDTSIEIGVGFTPERIRFADVTGDGKAEIIHIYPDGAVYSWTNKHGMTKFPYEEANQIGAGWHEPFRAHFS